MSIFFVLLAYNANFIGTLSAPVGRYSTQETTHWASAPTTRGTFSLLQSCVLTLILCMWTSLHLNLPNQSKNAMGRVVRKLKWTLLSLFAPEVIVFTAWSQWASAKALCADVNDIQSKRLGNRHRRWTIVHGFYAGMGGFVFEINDPAKPFIQNKLQKPFRATLTAHGVCMLARCGHLPYIFESSITDKSKADSLAKLLVCIQAVWCLLQYISRLASQLPVTLLELHTLGHALCAITIYMSWWHKPLDVMDPHVLPDELECLCAYMWMCDEINDHLDWDIPRENYDGRYIRLSEPAFRKRGSTEDHPVALRKGKNLPGTPFRIASAFFRTPTRQKIQWMSLLCCRRPVLKVPREFLLDQADVRRWRLAGEAINRYDELKHSYQYLPQEEFLKMGITNWPTRGAS